MPKNNKVTLNFTGENEKTLVILDQIGDTFNISRPATISLLVQHAQENCPFLINPEFTPETMELNLS